MYLPQFHRIPENDEFWGKGFTDWVTVKNAKPLFEGHHQPRVPLNDNYYDLSMKENVEWQCKLALDHGIYGFGVYHYWFNNDKNLLTKPAEIMRDDESIKTKYFFVWDNCSWKRSWSNVPGNDWAPILDSKQKKEKGPQILIPFILGEKADWINHYNYVSTHFKSNRYIKKNNKPVFCIFGYERRLLPMCRCWDECAKKDGFDGVYFIFKNTRGNNIPKQIPRYNYEPHATGWWTPLGFWGRVFRKLNLFQPQVDPITLYDYDDLWRKLLENARNHPEKELYHGGFISYDDSPRRGKSKSKIVMGASPAKFERYMSELIKISRFQNKEYIFLTAWNEWGEGTYLEPDKESEYEYLEAIKRAINSI